MSEETPTPPAPVIEETTEPSPADQIKKFAFILAIVCTILAAIPSIIAWAATPPGGLYLGSQYNLDDHMVYAAWMNQAAEGKVLFDNRFTVEQQPGLTVHIYFLLLGNLAKFISIPIATTLARLGFTFLFVLLLGRLLAELQIKVYTAKFALFMSVFGAGLGYLQWWSFGVAMPEGKGGILNSLLQGRLPIDVWQPEAFVFPSMLTNGLFMVSLCLIVGILTCVIRAKDSAKPILPGFLCMFALMNIHSYDVLLLALVLVGFLVASISSKTFDTKWLLRTLAIASGAIIPAAWFLYVLSQDTVFQARAATLTYAPNFRQILFGILPAILFGLGSLLEGEKPTKKEIIGLSIFTLILVSLFVMSNGANPDEQFLSAPVFAMFYIAMLACIALTARKSMAWNLFWAWAAIAVIAPYFPGLFQRKLGMAMALPWGIIAAFGMAAIFQKVDRQARNMVSALALVVVSASSLFWFQRELMLIKNNVSTTTVQPVFFSNDVNSILKLIKNADDPKVAASIPGFPLPQEGNFPFASPLLPDLNPLLSGLTGAYTYAGHWSETPNYLEKRATLQKLYSPNTSENERFRIVVEMQLDYLIVPDATTFREFNFADLSSLGRQIYDGPQFDLIEVAK